MNDIEKEIIILKNEISSLDENKNKVYDDMQEIISKRNNAQSKADRYTRKVDKIEHELNDLLIKKLSLILSPVCGFIVFSLMLLSSANPAITFFVTLLGFATGFRVSSNIINFKYLDKNSLLLMRRIFPSIETKDLELIKNRYYVEHFNSLVQDFSKEEFSLCSTYDDLYDKLSKLKNKYDELIDLYFKKKERELLPYYRELESVIENTIKNPNQFYVNICNGLNHKEKKDIIEDIVDKNCQNCTNVNCKMSAEQKDNLGVCNSWFNEVEIGKGKVLKR